MAKFVQGTQLNLELGHIMQNAKKTLVLVSPYIKLHDRYKSILSNRIGDPDLKISVVFGKNESDPSKSANHQDLEFLTEFPNVEIRYERRLHAKYYANEKKALLTSMNLYDYSQDNNIETGVLVERIGFGEIGKALATTAMGAENLDSNAWEYFEKVVSQSDLLYQKKPVYIQKVLGLKKEFKESQVVVDNLDGILKRPKDHSSGNGNRKTNKEQAFNKEKTSGYCIRTGVQIPFNVQNPLSEQAFNVWVQFGDEEYPEKYCHFSGEQSFGETCYRYPVLRRNWEQARGIMED